MGIAAALAIVFLLVLAYVAHNAEPILRQRVIANLEQRFQTPVELDSLHISVLKGLQVSGSGLRIAAPERPGAPPMLSVRSFSFRTGVRQLMEPSMRIDIVRVEGLRLRIPPKQHVPDAEQPGVKTRHGLLARLHIPSRSADSASTHWKIVVDRVECSDVVLTIETDKPGKQPLVFPITDVTLHDVGRGAPMPFQAHLVNPKPVGEIASTGRFGPWRSDDPRETPVDGSYSFTHADLNTIKGISGILSSTGSYGGVLGRIDVTGTTETPDFSLDVSEHAVDLRTEFNATVDGTNGDTILNSVRATLRNTVLDVKGSVIRTGGEHQPAADLDVDEAQAAAQQEAVGHMIQLQVVSTHARVEDLLRLGAKTSPPLMDGAMTLRAQLTIPPGRVNVSKKMRVQGSFTIRAATFSNPQWQQTVDKLSARASGKPEQASAGAAPEPVASQMGGSFALDDAVLSISQLHYQMPGAQVDVAGKYSLDGDTFNFAGKARTDAKASEMLTGWKSLLAMPFNKLLEKDGAGVEVPVTISGTRSAPKFGVDAGKLAGQILSRFKKGGGQDQKVPGQKQPDQKQPDQKQPDQKQPDQSQPPPKP
jgi:hypothetical protein